MLGPAAIATALAAAMAPHVSSATEVETLVYDRTSLDALASAPLGLTDADGVLRPATVDSTSLVGLDAGQIARRLRREIDRDPEPGFTPHVIAIDEIGNEFRDPAPRTRFKTVRVAGRSIRIASHNRIVSSGDGWRLLRRPPTPPVPGSDHPGSRLSAALSVLAGIRAPWGGGSYAERVHLLIAPAMVTSIGAGRGPHFTLDRSGSRSIRPAWRAVFPGLAKAGGLWLQMYHGGSRPLSRLHWRRAPGRIADYLVRHGGDARRVHVLFTTVTGRPAGTSACGSSMACQWAAARSSGDTRAVLANGAGAYRVQEASAWLRGYRRSLGAAG